MALIDRIKYDAASDDWFVWKHPGEEIKLGAQLVVNQTQEALFVRRGLPLDLFGPGTHSLVSGNLPLLFTLVDLPFGGKTPFTAEVWYINTHVKRDLRWGTQTPIPVLDPVYHYPLSLRAYGRWGIKVRDSRSLVKQLVGSLPDLQARKVSEYFASEIVQRFSSAMAGFLSEQHISVFQVNAKLNDLSACVAQELCREFERFGLELVNFNIERISLPEKEQDRLQEILGKNWNGSAKKSKRSPSRYTIWNEDKQCSNKDSVRGL